MAEILERIGQLYAVEERVRGQPPEVHVAACQTGATSAITALRTVLEQRMGKYLIN